MTVDTCPREQDVLDAIDARRWPDRLDEGLRAHVASCAACADLVVVAGVLREDHERLWQQAEVPSASLVWWRAQMRARAEAARAVSRPVLVAQVAFGLLVAALAAGGLVLTLGPLLGTWSGTLGQGWHALTQALAASTMAARGVVPPIPPAVWLAAGVWLLAVPAAIYVAFRE